MLANEVTRENVDDMVQKFYAKLLKDDVVGPFFTRKLGDDMNNHKWPEHLRTLGRFWVTMMTGQKGYGGDPLAAHMFLGQLTRESFERWLEHFRETVDECYEPEIADKFYKKADILADQFMEFLDVDGDEDDD